MQRPLTTLMLLNLNKVQLTVEAKKQEGRKEQEQENPRNPDAVAKEERAEVDLVVKCNNK